ncbi:MAG: HAD family phosphatase [Bacteroidales bacterium]|jgi:putative hydrolase of the HAD superfamily|nr:HAD family phosphatase [Bacteroidales bacterium]
MLKNIIFDFGGVIINIDYHRIAKAFSLLGIKNFNEIFSQAAQSDLIDRLELGAISPKDFRNEIRRLARQELSDETIDRSMNAILLDLPAERIELLQNLKKHYRLFLFSNTNKINYDCYYNSLKERYGFDLFKELFEKAYFSHETGMRKPDPDSFRFILNDSRLLSSETLFIDDSQQHIAGAQQAGLQTIWLHDDMKINMLFDEKYCLKQNYC